MNLLTPGNISQPGRKLNKLTSVKIYHTGSDIKRVKVLVRLRTIANSRCHMDRLD